MGDARASGWKRALGGTLALAFGLVLFLLSRASTRPAGDARVTRSGAEAKEVEATGLEARPGRAELERSATELASAEPLALGNSASASAAAPGRRLRVTGRVVDEAQRPIEGAEVRWRGQDAWRELARSDADGAFAGELAEPGHWLRFEILAQGRARAERSSTSVAGEALELGTIVLTPGGEVRGRVSEEGGRVPASVSVSVVPSEALPAGGGRSPYPESIELSDFEPLVEGLSAADGTFHLRGVPVGEHVLVVASRGGLAWSPALRFEVGSLLERDLVVPRADESHWIEGRVLGSDGVPLEGVSLTLDDEPSDLAALGYAGGDDHALSDRDGRFCFQRDEPGLFLLRVRDARARGSNQDLRGVASGRRDLELELAPVPMVEVRLVDARGAAIAWGNVWNDRGDSGVPLTPLGERGVGRIPFRGSELWLQAQAPGFARGTFGPYRSADVARGLELVLVPGGFVRGRLTSGGRPVRGARLDLTPSGAPLEARPSQGVAPDGWPFEIRTYVELSGQDGTSDGDGRFVLSVSSARWHALRVEADGFPLTVFGPFELDPARTGPELELALAPGGALEGRLLLPPGEPPLGRVVGVSNGWNFALTTAVDADGRFRFADLAPGEWQVRPVEPPVASLQVLRPAQADQPVDSEPEAVVRSGVSAHVVLDCTFARGHTLVGHFAFEGEDLSDWYAELRLPEDERQARVVATELAPDGSFRLVAARPGSYLLCIGGDGSTFERMVELVAAETVVELACASARVVLDLTEEHVSSVQLAQTGSDGTTFEAWSWRSSGEWRVAVPAGAVRVGVSRVDDDELSWSAPVELQAGEERRLELPPR